MSKSLPPRPNLEQLKNQAKELLKHCKAGDPEALKRFQEHHPQSYNDTESVGRFRRLVLSDAQLVIAREYGFASWPKLKEQVDSIALETGDPLELFKGAFTEHNAARFRELLER